MPHARSMRVVRSLAAAWLLLAVGCGADEPPAAVVGPVASAQAPAVTAAVGGDPLLERAREGIREGMLPAELEAEVLGSSAPVHARARRVLLAMAEPPPGPGDDEGRDGPAEGDGRPRPPPILPPAETDALPEATADPSRSADASTGSGTGSRASTDAGASAKASTGEPARGRSRAELGKLALRSSKGGATLTIAAPSSLVVGVANQPASGLVRLVIESAQAGSAVLTARPRAEGAEVTGVRQGQGTVQITVRLEPGWTLGSVQPFSGGAKVHLLAPP